MESVKRQSMLLTKLVEPEVRSVVIHRLAVPLNEQAVGIYPLVADLLCKFVLLSFEFFQKLHYGSRELYRSLRALSFCGICVNSLFCRVA